MKLQNTMIQKNFIYALFFIIMQAVFFLEVVLSRKSLTENFLLISITFLGSFYPLVTLVIIFIYIKQKNQQDVIEKLEQLNLDLRKQRHDFLNHLEAIIYFINIGAKEEAIKYLDRIGVITTTSSLASKIKNPHVAGVINSYAIKAEARKIVFELKTQSDFTVFPLSPVHTVVVLSNLIKNALENCEPGKGYVIIETETADGYFLFKISNNGEAIKILKSDNIADWQEEIFSGCSSKGKDRGSGLLIIKEILEHYDGAELFVAQKEPPTFVLKLKCDGEEKR